MALGRVLPLGLLQQAFRPTPKVCCWSLGILAGLGSLWIVAVGTVKLPPKSTEGGERTISMYDQILEATKRAFSPWAPVESSRDSDDVGFLQHKQAQTSVLQTTTETATTIESVHRDRSYHHHNYGPGSDSRTVTHTTTAYHHPPAQHHHPTQHGHLQSAFEKAVFGPTNQAFRKVLQLQQSGRHSNIMELSLAHLYDAFFVNGTTWGTVDSHTDPEALMPVRSAVMLHFGSGGLRDHTKVTGWEPNRMDDVGWMLYSSPLFRVGSCPITGYDVGGRMFI